MVCLLALAMALRTRAGKLVCIREDDLLARACLYETVVHRLGHGPRPWILALHHVLPCRLLKCPHDGLGRRSSQLVRYWVHAVAMHWYDDKVVLLLGFLWHGQTEDLVHVLPRQRKLDIASSTNRPYPAILLVDKLECELLPLRYREADAGICLECVRRGAR